MIERKIPMSEKNKVTLNRPNPNELLLTRQFQAPPALVFKAWTDPHQLAQWWGPNGFSLTTQEMEVKKGGIWRFIMHGPDGHDYKNRIVFTDVQEPNLLAYKHAGEDDDEPINFHVRATFDEKDGGTFLTMNMVFRDSADLNFVIEKYGADKGAVQTLTRLGEFIAAGPTIFRTSHIFAAPIDLVWKAWTDPDLLPKWWGPKGFHLTYHHLDLKPGGIFHYRMETEQGQEMWGKFVYREIEAPHRLLFVNSFSDKEGNVTRHPGAEKWPLQMLSLITFDDLGGKTRVNIRWEPLDATEEEKQTFADNHTSMRGGWSGTLERLVTFLKEYNN